MSELGIAAELAQIVTAITAVVGVLFALVEYRKSLKRARVDLAIEATKSWDSMIDDYTPPAFSLIRNHTDDVDVLRAIKGSQTIRPEKERHKDETYGFLMDCSGEIPAEVVNRLRISIVNLLNSWESISLLYQANRADRSILYSYFVKRLEREGIVALLGPFMDLYGEMSWEALRSLEAQMRS